MNRRKLFSADAAIELKRITDDDEPIRRLRAFVLASETFAQDVAEDEEVDPSEGLTPDEIAEVHEHLVAARRVLDTMYKRIGHM